MTQPVVKVPVGGSVVPKEPIVVDEPIKVEDPIKVVDPLNPPIKSPVNNEPAPNPPANPPLVEPVSKTIIVEDADGKEVTLNLNDNGDALDSEGKVVYTANQLADMDADDEEELINVVSSISGIQVLDESGKLKQYPNTAEGFAQREADIKAQTAREVKTKALNQFLEENADIASLYEYKRTYGTLEGYRDHIDYTKISIDPKNEKQQYDIIVSAEIQRGNSPERAKRIADMSKADGTLLNDSTESHDYLKTRQEREITASRQAQERAINDAIEAENKYFGVTYDERGKEVILNVENSVYDLVVAKGKIGNLVIPIEGVTVKTNEGSKAFTRRQIFDYISKPVKEVDGQLYTQAELDEYNRISKKENLIVTYLGNLFGNDLSSLVETSKLKDKADSIRRLKVATKTSPTPVNASKRVKIPVK